MLPAPACSRFGSPVKTSLIVSGSDVTTIQRFACGRSVKKSPHLAWQASRKRVGHRTKPTLIITRPRSGRGGRPGGGVSIATGKPTLVVCLLGAAVRAEEACGPV